MRTFNVITLLLVIIGGINWGLVGLFDTNLVAAIFGDQSAMSRLIYTLVGLSAVWQVVPFIRALSIGEVSAERHSRA